MQNKKLKIQNSLFLVIVLGGILFPLLSFAGEYTTTGGQTVIYEGLVPCGKEVSVNGVDQFVSCQLCHLFVMLQAIIDFVLVYIVFPIATLLLVVGGVMFFAYAENPQKAEQAKALLTATIVGLLIIFSAWLVIGLFFTAIGLSDFALQFTGPDNWFTVNCEITL
jgi:hypothetical protein